MHCWTLKGPRPAKGFVISLGICLRVDFLTCVILHQLPTNELRAVVLTNYLLELAMHGPKIMKHLSDLLIIVVTI